jgi:streptomycin 3"-adenylyltransferase
VVGDLHESSVPEAIAGFSAGLVEPVRGLLGEDLLAIYVYGSATVGDFDPRSSDLDLLVVVERPLGVTAKSGLIRLLWETAPRVPARGMECWVLTRETVAAGDGRRDFELMVNTHPQEPLTVDGATGARGIPVVELELVHDNGEVVVGPPPTELLAKLPRSLVVASMVEILRVEGPDSSEHYGVLNAARSLAYTVTGQHLSKLEGGRWVMAQGQAPKVVEEAVSTQLGLAPERSVTPSGRRYVEDAIKKLESRMSSPA